MSVLWQLPDFVSNECHLDTNTSTALVRLFDEDRATIPFIARYRQNVPGVSDLSTDDLRAVFVSYQRAKETRNRAEKLMVKAQNSKQQTEEERDKICEHLSRTMDANELEIIAESFIEKTTVISLARRARERGLAPAAELILTGEFCYLKNFVNDGMTLMMTVSIVALSNVEAVEQDLVYLLSEEIYRMTGSRALLKNVRYAKLTVSSALTKSAKALTEIDQDFRLIEHYKEYTNFTKDVSGVADYQILALNRAETNKIISWKVKCQLKRKDIFSPAVHVHIEHQALMEKAIADCLKRHMLPTIERAVRKNLMLRAERAAINCFNRNLRQRLMVAPLKNCPILAIDPGWTHGCKMALLDASTSGVFHLVKQGKDRFSLDQPGEKALRRILASMPEDARRLVIALGNGTGSRQAELLLTLLIADGFFDPFTVDYCVVSECGASVYSVSELAARELPDVHVNTRSAVSIGRRLRDPLAEYVKIEPRHLGLGMYQHSINEKKLDESLDLVVRECVSFVGVDVNTCSLELLEKVSGLNKRTAKNIIEFRETIGRITNRRQLLDVPGIGPKVFQQCSGFIHVYRQSDFSSSSSSSSNSGPTFPLKRSKRNVNEDYDWHPLDATMVHPEQYNLAVQIISVLGFTLDEVGSKSLRRNLLGERRRLIDMFKDDAMTESVLELLNKSSEEEGLRKEHPHFQRSVLSMNELYLGQRLDGIVENLVEFGIFINIGVGKSVLAHRNTYGRMSVLPEVNSRVRVEILKMELERERISVRILT